MGNSVPLAQQVQTTLNFLNGFMPTIENSNNMFDSQQQ